jgi:hypothetical protein
MPPEFWNGGEVAGGWFVDEGFSEVEGHTQTYPSPPLRSTQEGRGQLTFWSLRYDRFSGLRMVQERTRCEN